METFTNSAELDARIANKIFGWKDFRIIAGTHEPLARAFGRPPDGPKSMRGEVMECEVPHYSTDMTTAWKIVNNFFETDNWNFEIVSDQGELNCWVAEFSRLPSGKKYLGEADTPSVAICIAALKAAEGSETA